MAISTNAPYGLAKKMMLVQAQSYRQHPVNIATGNEIKI